MSSWAACEIWLQPSQLSTAAPPTWLSRLDVAGLGELADPDVVQPDDDGQRRRRS